MTSRSVAIFLGEREFEDWECLSAGLVNSRGDFESFSVLEVEGAVERDSEE